ncbi:MAG: DUF4388 domain-containing protein [Thermodesulfobacteriota bacterium]
MKKILAVNIDAVNLNILSSLLMEQTPDFEILTSKKIGEIDAIIKKLASDVIVVDLENPSPQDLKTLGIISRNHPKLPLILMTAFETGEIESAVKSIGTARYFLKPVDFNKLAELVGEKIKRNVGGEIHGISLTSFLQMSEMEKTSCTLKINADQKTGSLFLVKGALIAAESGELTGEEAVFDILSWKNPTIEIDDSPVNRKKEIESPLISLLMESARRKDEKKSKAKKPAHPAADAPRKKIKKAPDVQLAAETPKTEPVATAAIEPQVPEAEAVPETEEELLAEGKFTDASKILKRKRLLSQALKAGAAVAIIVMVAGLWQYAASPGLAKRKLNKAMAAAKAAPSAEESIAILDAYLQSGPDAPYALQAQTLKQTLSGQKEVEELEKVAQAVSQLPLDEKFIKAAENQYRQFLKQFPDSRFKEEVNRRISEIPAMVDDAEYARLKSIPGNHYSERLLAYQSYLTNHPDSTNAASVQAMMNNLGEAFYEHIHAEKTVCDQEKNWQRCIQLCQYFLDNCTQGHARREDIAALQRAMTAQAAYLKIAGELEKADPFSQTAEALLTDYLKAYPDSPVRDTVEAQLDRIGQKKNLEKSWQQLVEYAKNDRNDIFDRVQRMESYLQVCPEKHAAEAKALHAWLIKEKNKKQQQINQQAENEQIRRQREAFIGQERIRIRNLLKQSGGRFSIVTEDTITDNQTGLTWCMFDSSVLTSHCIDYKNAEGYVRGLATGGYRDWRLPDPSELLVLYNGNPRFPVTSSAKSYWTSEVFSAAWQEKVNTVIQKDTGIWEKHETDLKKCGAVRAVRP